ncbi:MAG: PAS domain S-box protein [Thermodesulfobacteriota bacterium]
MARFVCRGLSEIPSVKSVGILIRGNYYSENNDLLIQPENAVRLFDSLLSTLAESYEYENTLLKFKTKYDVECLKIETVFKLYGFLFLRTIEKDLFSSLKPYIENTLNLIALIIENNAQKQLLLKNKEDLEKQVEIRTSELKNSLRDLKIEIEEHKQTEEMLKKSRKELADIFSTSLDMLCIADIRTATFLKVNPAFTRVLGYSEQELLNRPFLDFVHEDDLPATVQLLEEKLKKGEEVINFQNRYRCKDGRFCWLNWVCQPVSEQGVTYAAAHDISEQKTIDQALRASEALLKKSQEMARVGSWELDVVNNSLIWSDEVYRIFGLIPQEFKPSYEGFLDAIHPDDRVRVDSAYERSVNEGKDNYEIQHRIVRKQTSEVRYVHEKCEHIKDEKGKIIRSIGMVQDITERIQSEEALKESENKFRSVTEQSLVGIYLIQDDIFKYVNPKFAEIFGYSVKECLAKISFSELVHPDDLSTVRKNVHQRISGDTPSMQYSFRGIKKNKEVIFVEIFGSSILYEGRPAATGTMLDITERMRTQKELKRLAEAVRQASEGIVITRVDGSIEYANPAFEKITGHPLDEVVGKTPRFLKSGHQDSSFYKNLWDTILSGYRWEGRMVNKRKNGTLYTADCFISPVKNQEGSVLNFVWITRDITTQLDLERRIAQSQKLESIGTLAGGIAHDFNNILSAVIGYTELALNEAQKESRLEKYLLEVHKAGTRAKDLTKQILTFARHTDGEVKPVRVDVITKEALKLIRSTTPTFIEIRHHIQSDSLVMADPTRIHQVLMNLCTNACHAMEKAGGILEVSLTDVLLGSDFTKQRPEVTPGDYLKLTVSDTGHGIHPDQLGKIFEPFFTTKKPGEGTGMGLSIVHGIVTGYGGTITVESNVGKGSLFTAFLPVTKTAVMPKPFVLEKLPIGTERIFFIDDELSLMQMNSQALEGLGYTVTARTSSIEALEIFKIMPDDFDIVITDMTMPNMTGDKLATEMIKVRPDIPIILCTGFSKKISEEKAAEIGIRAFAMKPISPNELAKIVRTIFDNPPK